MNTYIELEGTIVGHERMRLIAKAEAEGLVPFELCRPDPELFRGYAEWYYRCGRTYNQAAELFGWELVKVSDWLKKSQKEKASR